MAKKWRGQRQTLFVLDFHGEDRDFCLDAFEHPEFQSFAWFPVDEAFERISKLKRRILEKTVEALPEVFDKAA